MEPLHRRWAARLQPLLPNRETLAAHPWLRPVADRLLAPQLWRLQHEAVARGVAVGTFWAFAMPVGQVVMAAAHCSWWRANIPVAAAMTLVTNPLTIGFWLWLAYQLGALVLGAPALPTPAVVADVPALPGAVDAWGTTAWLSASAWLGTYGWPTLLGMGLFALGGAALGYVSVKLVWRLRVIVRRRQRR